jgi:tetratricopeptide (TPR) repeat protein
MRKAILVSALAIFFCGALASGANADDKRDEAKAHYNTGNTHFKLARFDQALAEYSKAYEIVPIPGLLFNIAQCHLNLKNYERATFFFEGYLREKPDAPDRLTVLGLIKEANQAIESKRIADEAAKTAAEEEAKSAEAERRKENPKFMPNPTPATGPVDGGGSSPVYTKWWFWSAIGGAALAVGGGVYLATSGDTVLPSGSLGTLDGRQ